jgi:phenylacetate-CoA ligase
VRGREFRPSDEDDLFTALRRRIGDEADVAIEYRETLPRTNSGKLRFVVSEVPKGDLESVATSGNANAGVAAE